MLINSESPEPIATHRRRELLAVVPRAMIGVCSAHSGGVCSGPRASHKVFLIVPHQYVNQCLLFIIAHVEWVVKKCVFAPKLLIVFPLSSF